MFVVGGRCRWSLVLVGLCFVFVCPGPAPSPCRSLPRRRVTASLRQSFVLDCSQLSHYTSQSQSVVPMPIMNHLQVSDSVTVMSVNNVVNSNSPSIEIGGPNKRLNSENLVALVREQPALYDYSHPAHCNRDVTSSIWSQIAAQLETTEVTCKTKWANLRSNFVRELRRIRPSPDGTVYPPQWPLFKPLSFLLPYLKIRGSPIPGVDDATLLQLEFQPPRRRKAEREPKEPTQKRVRFRYVASEEEKDDDKLFMLSLVPKMRQLSPIDNLSFRIEVQQLLLQKMCNQVEETATVEAVETEAQELLEQVEESEEQIVYEEEPDDRLAMEAIDYHEDRVAVDQIVYPDDLHVKIETVPSQFTA